MLARPRPSPGPVPGFGVDTFAFGNDSRIHHRGQPDMYCNRCFLMARAVGQFRRFARFAPEEPRLPSAAYAELVHRVTRRVAGVAARRRAHRHWPSYGPGGRCSSSSPTSRGSSSTTRCWPSTTAPTARTRWTCSSTIPTIRPRRDRPDPRDERFHAAPLCGVSVPYFRAFRQYYSPFF